MLTDFVCGGRGATTGGGVSSSSSSSPSLADGEVAVPFLPGCNSNKTQTKQNEAQGLLREKKMNYFVKIMKNATYQLRIFI